MESETDYTHFYKPPCKHDKSEELKETCYSVEMSQRRINTSWWNFGDNGLNVHKPKLLRAAKNLICFY